MSDNAQKLSFASAIHSFARSRIGDSEQNLVKQMPGHISKILDNDFVEFTFDVVSDIFTLPKVVIPQAFSKWSREPTQVGDRGYCVPNSISLGGADGQGGGTANLTPRGNLSTGSFHPISAKNFDQRDPNQFIQTGGPTGHKIQTIDKSTHTVLDALNNIVHTASSAINHTAATDILHTALAGLINHKAGTDILHQALSGLISHTAASDILHTAIAGVLSHQAPQIQQIAELAMTHGVTAEGVFNLVAKQFKIGAAPAGYKYEANAADPRAIPVPPIPSLPTILQVIGTITATANILASGMVGAGGGFAGTPGGGYGYPGAMGEIVYSNMTTPVNLSDKQMMIVTSIDLAPGNWDVQGEVWFAIGAGGATEAQCAVAPSNYLSPQSPDISVSKASIKAFITNDSPLVLGMRPCYANLTNQTTYFLTSLLNFPSGTCTAMGNIWAKRL